MPLMAQYLFWQGKANDEIGSPGWKEDSDNTNTHSGYEVQVDRYATVAMGYNDIIVGNGSVLELDCTTYDNQGACTINFGNDDDIGFNPHLGQTHPTSQTMEIMVNQRVRIIMG